jgi:aspartate/methionine/tyrosine aminotransferase
MFSRLSQQIPRSGIRAVMDLAARTEGVISLAAGEPSFRTPEHIIEAAFEAARAGHTRYTPTLGTWPLREAVAARYAARWGSAVSPNEVLIGAGAVNAILATLLVIVDEGQQVLVPDPGWPNYDAQVRVARAVPVGYPLRPEDGYLPGLDVLDRLVTPKTKVIVTNNPSNPCGVVWPRERVAALMDWARSRDLWVMADEIYEDLVFDGEMVPSPPFNRDRTVLISGCSKTFAMTGWRIGWAVAPAKLIELAVKTQEPLVSCASDVSQAAALAALTGPQEFVEEMRLAYRRRRDVARQVLQPAGLLPTVPAGAFYAMVDLRGTGLPSQDAAALLIEEERIAAVPVSAFGKVAEGFLRISLASSDEDVRIGCERIARFAERHAYRSGV